MGRFKTLAASALCVLLSCLSAFALAAPEPGWYWNPAEPGRGFFIESTDTAIYIGGYLYDADGHALWVVAGGPNTDVFNYSGRLLTFDGGQTVFGTYHAPAPGTDLGAMAIHFGDDTHATLTWPGGTLALERYYFGTGTPDFQPFTGWWWNADESGNGYSVEVQGSNLFLIGYMYDDTGRAVWYYSAGPVSSPDAYSGDLLQFGGGQTMGGAYKAPGPPVTIGKVDIAFAGMAEATLTFSSTGSAVRSNTLTLKAGGSRGTKAKPLFPKKGTYVPPKQFNGTFTLQGHNVVKTNDLNVDQVGITRLSNIVWSVRASDIALPVDYDLRGTLFGNLNQDISTLAGPCNAMGFSADVPFSDTTVSVLSVDEFRKYGMYVHVDQLRVPFLTIGECTIDGMQVPYSVPAGNLGIDLDYQGTVIKDSIRGGGVRTLSGSGSTTTGTFTWQFDGVRGPTP